MTLYSGHSQITVKADDWEYSNNYTLSISSGSQSYQRDNSTAQSTTLYFDGNNSVNGTSSQNDSIIDKIMSIFE